MKTLPENSVLVLQHGFCRGARHMQVWRDGLGDMFDRVITPDLPTTHKSFEHCLEVLEKTLQSSGIDQFEHIYLVGHSMGGLLLREYLQRQQPDNARYLVCVGTPHYGSKLADIAMLLPGAGWIWPPLKALKSSSRKKLTTPDIPGLKIGVIAGRNNAHWPGKFFLSEQADGLVEVFSALAPDAACSAFTLVPHDYMQYDPEIVNMLRNFLQYGMFR